MKVLKTYADIGSLKIYNETMSLYLRNGVGDLPSKIIIEENQTPDEEEAIRKELETVGNMVSSDIFEVKTTAYLSEYDCDEKPIYQFKAGFCHVTLFENAVFLLRTPYSL